MKLKKIAAAIAAAATAIAPLSADRLSVFVPSAVYAAEHAMGAALPEWIPQSFESALDFRNTYGATHIQDGLVCIVFREQYEKVPEGEPQGVLRYDIRTTKDMMKELFHKTYADENSRYCYEVVAYYAPQKQGNFEVALVDTWIQSSELDLGYNHAIANYSFSIGEENDITETDIYGWLPDSYTEFYDYTEKNGSVSAKDEFVVFCINDTAGIRYQWEETSDNYNGAFSHYISSYCSRETTKQAAGGKTPHMEVYKALTDGNSIIKWSFVPSDDNQKLQASKNLIADAIASDNASKVTLLKGVINNAEFSYKNYSLYGTEVRATGEDAYFTYDESKYVVAKSQLDLYEFLTFYLNDDAAKEFVSQYSEEFFEKNVLIVNTYLDKYRGYVSNFGLDCVYFRDSFLYVDYMPIINGNQSRTSYLSILQLTMPKDEFTYGNVEWECKEALADNVKRITFIDEDANEFVDMDNVDLSKLFGIEMKYIEGQNPYYWEAITAEWFDLNIDEKYLPYGYELSKEKPREVINNGNNTGDITFWLRKKETGDIKYAIDKYSATTRNMFSSDHGTFAQFPQNKSFVITSSAELSETVLKYFSEEYQEKIFCSYDDIFFKNNVLLLNMFIDSTGGDKVKINDNASSDDNIIIFYTKPAPDFQVCNTDYLFVLQAAVPKSNYKGQKAEFKCMGDANGDGDLGIADIVTLQKWLNGSSDTKLADWKAADLCRDGSLDIFDLVAMRKLIIDVHNLDAPVKYYFEAQYLRGNRTPSGSREPVINIITSAGEMKKKVQTSYRAEELEKYNDEWFSTHKLMVISLEEGSGSIRHGITEFYSDHVTINRTIPDVMTADMAVWDIFIELDKDARISDDFTVKFTETKLY